MHRPKVRARKASAVGTRRGLRTCDPPRETCSAPTSPTAGLVPSAKGLCSRSLLTNRFVGPTRHFRDRAALRDRRLILGWFCVPLVYSPGRFAGWRVRVMLGAASLFSESRRYEHTSLRCSTVVGVTHGVRHVKSFFYRQNDPLYFQVVCP